MAFSRAELATCLQHTTPSQFTKVDRVQYLAYIDILAWRLDLQEISSFRCSTIGFGRCWRLEHRGMVAGSGEVPTVSGLLSLLDTNVGMLVVYEHVAS